MPDLDLPTDKIRFEKIGKDKAFEIEVKFALDEINRRMDYNRRTQGFQITTIGVLVAALISKGSLSIDKSIVNAVCVAVSIINGMFLLEIRQNTYTAKLAAIYVKDVINSKYRSENGNVILEWEDFLDRHRRNTKATILNRLSFVGSAHLLMSIYLTLLPVFIFVLDVCNENEPNLYVESIVLVSATMFNLILIFRYVYSGLELNSGNNFVDLVNFTSAAPNDFEYFYDLRKKTMEEHFVRVGKIWDDNELRLHQESFRMNKLVMILYRGHKVGFVNVVPSKSEVLVSHFCIDPDNQSHGLGRYVMDCIVSEAERANKKVVLDVLKGNKAIRLYRRMGFVSPPQKESVLLRMERQHTILGVFSNRIINFWRKKNFIS